MGELFEILQALVNWVGRLKAVYIFYIKISVEIIQLNNPKR